jgi:hypothetical protein
LQARRLTPIKMSSKFESKYSAPSSSSSSQGVATGLGSGPEDPIITVGYATDVEGNYDYWSRYIELSKILNRLPTGELQLLDNCHFVFGGDVVDRGPGDLRVLADLLRLKRSYSLRVHFIMGNRDINKMRIPVELDEGCLKQTPKVYWLRENDSASTINFLESVDSESAAERLKWVKMMSTC